MGFGGKYKVRERGLFDPHSTEPHRLSRSKIDLFIECPRCFYLDQRFGIGRVDMPAFTLNNAVDELLKKEFDIHRDGQTSHPLMDAYGIKAVPFKDERLVEWRDSLRRGIAYHDKDTNLILRGGVDDVWKAENGELIVVDYKATSKRKEIELYDSYKLQVEFYQWLFQKNGFEVSETAYFVYVNGKTDMNAFDGKLEFDVQIISHKGKTDWIEPTILKVKQCLMSDDIPSVGQCDWCPYREHAGRTLQAKMIQKALPSKIIPGKTNENQTALF